MAAAASDKARFFLEQQVPELQSYKEKGIFSPAEITAIASKRSEFEHRINMAGASSPSDYARYASYEQTLDALRRKRCKRMGVKGTNFAGQKRVFSVLERGTRKFPGDIGLWIQYLEYCKHESANSKLAKGLTKVLRMHPTKWELWTWGARHYFEAQGDMVTARSFMQRGLRFCQSEQEMWVQYMRLEMIYVAKVAARRKILKLDEETAQNDLVDQGMDVDEIALPSVTAADFEPQVKDKALAIDDATLQKLAQAPVFSGAIPMAIADAAAKAFKDPVGVLSDLFDCTFDFDDVPCTRKILSHILALVPGKSARKNADMVRHVLEAKIHLGGISHSSAEFPSALGRTLVGLKAVTTQGADQEIFKHQEILRTLLPLLADTENLDIDVEKVLDVSVRQSVKALRAIDASRMAYLSDSFQPLNKALLRRGVKARTLIKYGLQDDAATKIARSVENRG